MYICNAIDLKRIFVLPLSTFLFDDIFEWNLQLIVVKYVMYYLKKGACVALIVN